MRRPDWTVIWTESAFEAVPIAEAKKRLRPMHKHHAVALAEKLNADEVTVDVAEHFGPGEIAQ